jgi:Asp/Glu/hydantoin racemase
MTVTMAAEKKHPVSFLHTSPAAIPPLMRYYGEVAPDLEITNQLDDGLLRMLAAHKLEATRSRIAEMLAVATDTYKAELVMITCSSLPSTIVDDLQTTAGVPLFKIDDPLGADAVRAGNRLGVVITFRPSIEPTNNLLRTAAAAIGKRVELITSITPEAYDALLSGNPDRHDDLLLDAIDTLSAENVDGIVLAQVSMARLLPQLQGRVNVPVYSSLTSSLAAIRKRLPVRT